MLIFLSFNVETSQRTDRRSSVIVIAVIVVVVAVVVVVVAIISLFCTDIVRVSRVSKKKTKLQLQIKSISVKRICLKCGEKIYQHTYIHTKV